MERGTIHGADALTSALHSPGMACVLLHLYRDYPPEPADASWSWARPVHRHGVCKYGIWNSEKWLTRTLVSNVQLSHTHTRLISNVVSPEARLKDNHSRRDASATRLAIIS